MAVQQRHNTARPHQSPVPLSDAIFDSSYVLHFRIQPVHHFHALLVHGKHNPSAQNQPRQPRQRTTPKCENALVLEDAHRAARCVSIHLLSLYTLHPRLDRVERLRHGHSNKPRHAADGEGCHCAELLPRSRPRLSELPE